MTLAKVGQGRPEESERAQERAVDGPQPGRLIEVLEATGRGAARIDDQQVETAKRPSGGFHGGRRSVGGRQVRPDREATQPCGLGIQRGTRPRDDRDLGALGGQCLGDRTAESAAPTTHQGSCSGQSKFHAAHGTALGVGCADVRT